MTLKSCHFRGLFQMSFIEENKIIQWKFNSIQVTEHKRNTKSVQSTAASIKWKRQVLALKEEDRREPRVTRLPRGWQRTEACSVSGKLGVILQRSLKSSLKVDSNTNTQNVRQLHSLRGAYISAGCIKKIWYIFKNWSHLCGNNLYQHQIIKGQIMQDCRTEL